MSLEQIFEGWKNHLLPEERQKVFIEHISNERLAICETCDKHSKNQASIRPDAHCTECGCTLSAKTKCLTCECPLKKWVAQPIPEDNDITSIVESTAVGGERKKEELITNFDITANWSLTTPVVIDEASFKTFLESGEDGDGSTNNLTDVVINDFSLIGNRLKCNLTASGSELYLTYTEVSVKNGIGNIVGLKTIYLIGNQNLKLR